MEAACSFNSEYDDEQQALDWLLDAFGSMFSLREIASAYCKAGRNVNLASEILSQSEGSNSSSAMDAPNGGLLGEKASELPSGSSSEKLILADGNFKASKPKKYSASVGTVSGIIGKGYARPTKLTNESGKTTKPLKFNSKELPISELLGEESFSDSAKKDAVHKDVEGFLFKMLGDGFKLDMDVIQEVLGYCGYDMKKSVEKLLDISASTLEKSDGVFVGLTEKSTDECQKLESLLCQEKSKYVDQAQRNGIGLPKSDKERYDLEKQVLASLFSVPERTEVAPRKITPSRTVKRPKHFKQVVVEPPTDNAQDHKDITVELQQDTKDDEEDSYHVLRRGVKEHWVTMKEYYKAAADAFAKGDHAQAEELRLQGQFFNSKAREADEKSSRKILEIRNKESRDEMLLDLHDHDAKEALRPLKVHLTSLSGNPAFQYLKVIVDANNEDRTKGARKRLVMKLLEKESIKWTEDVNPGTILIRVDEIDPKGLSFAEKGNA